MIHVYIGTPLGNTRLVEILYPNLGSTERPNVFGETLFNTFTRPLVDIVNDVSLADCILLPHNYNVIKNNHEYIARYEELSKKFDKKVIVFFPGDSDEKVVFSNAIVFRNSQYRAVKAHNEIIMPAFAVDLANGEPIYRDKGVEPVIGFCGWAGLGTPLDWLRYGMEYIRTQGVYKKGLYFRRKTIKILEKEKRIKTNFIIRSSYTGNMKTIGLSPEVARREYIENMKNSDFILAPKGDGNFSVRFYEALSLGRIPLLIDTDCSLPLEDIIDYSTFIVKVDYRNIDNTGKIVKEFYKTLSKEDYVEMQKSARKAFDSYLRIDAFFTYMFTGDRLKQYIS